MELLKKLPCGAYRCNTVVTINEMGGDLLPCDYKDEEWRIVKVDQAINAPLCSFLLINGKVADIFLRTDARSDAEHLTVKLCGIAKLPEKCRELKIIPRPFTTIDGKPACLLELNGGCFVCNAFRNGQLWIEVSIPRYYRFDNLIASGHSLCTKGRVFAAQKFEFKGTAEIDADIQSPVTIIHTSEGDISLCLTSTENAIAEVQTENGSVCLSAKGFEKANVMLSSLSSEDLFEPGMKPGRRAICLTGRIVANYGQAVLK